MNARRRRLLLATVGPLLEPDERVEVATIVNLTSVSVGRTAAFAAASVVMSGGMAVIPTPAPMYLTMTDRRLLVFRADPMFARPREHVMTVARAGLVRSEIRERLLNSFFVVSVPGAGQSLKIIFPLAGRRDRNAVAAALPLAG
ncbi:hypothetical protein [Streptomyces sp. enrichment culture]|uniref:hypothetical protein n=1 Tax=Streptomyces sp. enrichment culture TaxID=1795815 RepID=UPI003F553925